MVLATPILAFDSLGDIYVWKDQHGRHHYSNRKDEGSVRISIRAGHAYHTVKRVFDGDTLLLDDGRRVRLLGINSPEIETASKEGEPVGAEAKIYLRSLVLGKKVRLETGLTQHDKYQRILAHVFTEDDIHLNRELVEHGYAVVIVHPPEVMYLQSLLESQRRAERKEFGIWNQGNYRRTPIISISQVKKRGWQRLFGKPKRIQSGKKYSRLVFFDNIDLRIPNENLSHFPSLDYYLGKELEIRGWASRRNNKFSVLVRHPSAIVLSEKNGNLWSEKFPTVRH